MSRVWRSEYHPTSADYLVSFGETYVPVDLPHKLGV
jgi:hypothetical protein